MTEKKPRSAFLPILLILVGVVVCAGVVLAFVPISKCDVCLGVGKILNHEVDLFSRSNSDESRDSVVFRCNRCSSVGRIGLYLKWFEWRPLEDGIYYSWEDEERLVTEEQFLLVMENRQPNP